MGVEGSVYRRMEAAVEAQRLDAAAVEALSADAMRTMSDAGKEAVTATLLGNVQRAIAAGLRQKELEAAAAWMEEAVRSKFPEATAAACGHGRIEIRLDGLREARI